MLNTMRPKNVTMPALLACASLLLPASAMAQPQRSAPVAPARTLSAAVQARADRLPMPQHRGGGFGPVGMGAVVGGLIAVVGTAAAAGSYGNNESNRFCAGCMAQWSAVTVPIGVGVGALAGLGIQRMRRSISAVPVISRKTTGVLVTARF